MTRQEEFIKLVEGIHREGIYDLMQWLVNDTDFLDAPASTKYHGACVGGLLTHSLNVYYRLDEIAGAYYDDETILIVSLFHDLCKCDFYAYNFSTDKYIIKEQFPYGSHGGKSVYLLMKHGLKITDEEAAAINNHMGAWDNTTYHNPSNAFSEYPLALYLHIADMLATYLDEA